MIYLRKREFAKRGELPSLTSSSTTVVIRLYKSRGEIPEAKMYRTKIGHVKLKVRDLDRAIGFYVRSLNFHLVERVENHHAFLSGNDSHHEIALQAIAPDAPRAPANSIGMDHVAFEVPDKKSLADAFKALAEAGISVTTADNLISWSIYFDDPDGNGIEIYCDTRKGPHGQPLWHGIRKPLEPEKIMGVLPP